MISFENTAVAFSGKRNEDLKRSYWLFKLVANAGMVKAGEKISNFAIRYHLPVNWVIKPTIFSQFCGGETINECDATIEKLGKYRIGTILDYSVEGKESETDFDNCTNETIATINKACGNKNIPFCVFKVTGLARFGLLEKLSSSGSLSSAEETEYESVRARVNKICRTASDLNVPIFIDAEESWIQPAIDNLANDMMAMYNSKNCIVYNTYQLYRKDRLEYLMNSYMLAEKGEYFLGAKLVRGAYMEKERKRASEMNYPSPIQDDKEQTDKDYNAALKFCISHINRISICAGTHNESSSLYLTELMKENNVVADDKRAYFSQLLGMSDHISYNLANAGYNVAKYVPYGPVKEVLPYLIRRARENTSVKGQTGRELSLIIKELRRRKSETKSSS